MEITLLLIFALSAHCITGEVTVADCYKQPKGLDYHGSKSTTKSGLVCQHWNTNSPHNRYFTPDEQNVENYCRNPSNSTEPWCYTTDKNTRWEYCGIPKCSAQVCYTGNGNDYRGDIKITESGKLCQDWTSQTPHKHHWSPLDYPYLGKENGVEANYCRLAAWKEGVRPWCYTMDENARWEYCDVPKCPDGDGSN